MFCMCAHTIYGYYFVLLFHTEYRGCFDASHFKRKVYSCIKAWRKISLSRYLNQQHQKITCLCFFVLQICNQGFLRYFDRVTILFSINAFVDIDFAISYRFYISLVAFKLFSFVKSKHWIEIFSENLISIKIWFELLMFWFKCTSTTEAIWIHKPAKKFR